MECIHEKYCKLSISVVWLIKTEAINFTAHVQYFGLAFDKYCGWIDRLKFVHSCNG
jgi:hypothetical protein